MTLKEFFRQARRGRKWSVVRDGLTNTYVRCEAGFCPLAAVGYKRKKMPNPSHAAARIGLSLEYAYRIADAADFATDRDRKWLLKNLGLRA